MNPTAAHPTGNDDQETGTVRVTRVTDPAQLEAGAVAHLEEHTSDGWTWGATISRGPNGLVISHLEVRPDDPGASVTSRMLRNITLGAILSIGQEWLEASDIPGLQPATGWVSATSERTERDGTVRPGRAPLTPELMREVAEGYLEETGIGKPRGAIKRLARQLGKPEATVSRWVVRARREGWLGPAMPGREGAEVGPRLFEARAADLEAKLHAAADELSGPTGK